MKIRTGRRNQRNLYLQLGDEPSDSDPCLGLIVCPVASAVIADAINRSGLVRADQAPFLGPERVFNALECG
jgi:hypothetical protein